MHTELQVEVGKLTVKVEDVLIRIREVLNTLKEFATQKDIEALSKRIETLESKNGKYIDKFIISLIASGVGAVVTLLATLVAQKLT